jgi:hypothetical protein
MSGPVHVIRPLLETLDDQVLKRPRMHTASRQDRSRVCAIYGTQVLMDGMHDIERAAHVTENVLVATYSAMMQQVLF